MENMTSTQATGISFQEWYENAGCPKPSEAMMEQAFRYAFGMGARWMEQMLTTTVQP